MTLYLDTSSLFKLYVEEAGSDDVRQDLAEADTAATSAVSYAEARSAFARLRRDGDLNPATFLEVAGDNPSSETRFSSFDRRLKQAATRALRAARRSG